MKKFFDDNQIMTPDAIDKIAIEYAKKYTDLNADSFVTNKLQNNIDLLEYIASSRGVNNANLQKHAIKTYGLIKNLCTKVQAQNCNPPKNFTKAKQSCINNSIDIVIYITNSIKHLLTDFEYKAIKTSLETILDLVDT